MSRPKPVVIAEVTNRKTFKTEQILEAEAIWAIFYKDKPFNLKTVSLLANQSGPKYKKISFSNSGHALNLAKKLNTLFNCNDFSVYKLTIGKKIT